VGWGRRGRDPFREALQPAAKRLEDVARRSAAKGSGMQRRQHRQVTVNGLCYDATAPRRIFDFTRLGIAERAYGSLSLLLAEPGSALIQCEKLASCSPAVFRREPQTQPLRRNRRLRAWQTPPDNLLSPIPLVINLASVDS
jgi:hypothetical protein